MDIQRLLSDFIGKQTQGSPQRQPSHGATNSRVGQASGSGGSLLDQVGGMMQGRGGTAVTSAVVGGLASQLFSKKGKSFGKGIGGSALKLGGAALVAGLAYKAYQSYQAKSGATALPGAQPVPSLPAAHRDDELPAPAGTAFMPSGEEDARARLMLSAMIAAAKADGYIDADEERAIYGRIDDMEMEADEKGLVMDELRRPKTIDDLAAEARTPEIAMEIYTASVLAIDADHPAERAYLDLLASRLDLPPDLAREIRQTTGAE
ncbi:tellurite resistance TerB family protein [Fulvimarina sp. 2208YS6-2-32]|uniref:Tellurite resistance TerB family protein n=1 Tax=Fulvimarina uroteuthidis TaxID=3098149 RepID=A0ABU5HWU0_9HYPH|nr:tellurite resistance TerB family protein [Fulvimarina sp. 2208YS6-2-32]MDY8107608.1 tellurite resistance TerB family protein [Fulvimarina sp. 2208YS6-2-32]